MKKFVFRIDGSTAPYNMATIFNHVKGAFPEAKKEEKSVGTYVWDCYISVNKENEKEAFDMIKGFASQIMYCY